MLHSTLWSHVSGGSLRRPTRVKKYSVVLLVAMLTLVPGLTSAGAATSSSSLLTLIAAADKDVTAIREFYFCETNNCRSQKTLQSAMALAGANDLARRLKTTSTIAATPAERALLRTFTTDGNTLLTGIAGINSQTTMIAKTVVAGIVYFESSYVTNDTYVLLSAVNHSRVSFKKWSVGLVGATQTMQVIIQLETPKASTSELLAANQGLILIAQNLLTHANSPFKDFNAKLTEMATSLKTYSIDEVKVINSKVPGGRKTMITAELKKFFNEYQALIALQNQLAK